MSSMETDLPCFRDENAANETEDDTFLIKVDFRKKLRDKP